MCNIIKVLYMIQSILVKKRHWVKKRKDIILRLWLFPNISHSHRENICYYDLFYLLNVDFKTNLCNFCGWFVRSGSAVYLRLFNDSDFTRIYLLKKEN